MSFFKKVYLNIICVHKTIPPPHRFSEATAVKHNYPRTLSPAIRPTIFMENSTSAKNLYEKKGKIHFI